MNLEKQKNLAARVLKCGKGRIWMDPERLEDISSAITGSDIRGLNKKGYIKKLPKKGISRTRKQHIAKQKKKGRRKGPGSRKGKIGTRLPKKRQWIKKVTALRKKINELEEQGKITKRVYRDLYRKISGGFFHSKSHLDIYLRRNELLEEDKNEEKKK